LEKKAGDVAADAKVNKYQQRKLAELETIADKLLSQRTLHNLC
jgi:hypothetical protein